MIIKEKNSELAWKKVLKYVFENGKDFTDRDNRTCREVLNVVIKIEKADSITRPIEIVNSFEKWVYPPLEELETFILSKKEIPGYYYNYGGRAFNVGGLNQVDEYVIPLLKKDPTSRRATIVFYNPEKDSFLFKKDVPSMILINFNIDKEKLHATTLIRSNDLFFGWPANIYQSYVLQNYVAKKIGCEVGGIITNSISAHIFEDQFEYIKKIV